jgi:hypothetical protein
MAKLRLDRRLTRRSTWISPEELERELAKLPDVSDKIAETDEDDDAPAAAGRVTSGDPETL